MASVVTKLYTHPPKIIDNRNVIYDKPMKVTLDVSMIKKQSKNKTFKVIERYYFSSTQDIFPLEGILPLEVIMTISAKDLVNTYELGKGGKIHHRALPNTIKKATLLLIKICTLYEKNLINIFSYDSAHFAKTCSRYRNWRANGFHTFPRTHAIHKIKTGILEEVNDDLVYNTFLKVEEDFFPERYYFNAYFWDTNKNADFVGGMLFTIPSLITNANVNHPIDFIKIWNSNSEGGYYYHWRDHFSMSLTIPQDYKIPVSPVWMKEYTMLNLWDKKYVWRCRANRLFVNGYISQNDLQSVSDMIYADDEESLDLGILILKTVMRKGICNKTTT